ncbi:MAG: hypothetical protein AABY53_09000 [Bdellovibrionota bacterium]
MVKLFIIPLLVFALDSKAGNQSPYTAEEQFVREGRYVKITMLMGNPIKIFISGKEALRLDTSSLKIEFRPAKAKQWNELKINKSGNYYEVESQSDYQMSGNALEVKTTLKNKGSEVFEFKTP